MSMSMKRLSPSSDCSDATEPPLKRTHRTHEENQERAYIAASRRADRDIEHRIRSALKASDCRRKRTGRGLKITREAVMGDEQYESEDDDHTTRRFSLPATTNLSNNNPPPYTTTRADRYAEIDALFAKHFPHVQLSSRWSTAQPQQQPRQQPNYPQPLPLQPAYVPRYSQHDAAAAAAAAAVAAAATIQPSPPLTPPMSYPLPPTQGEDDEKAGSMSPLALEASQSRSTTTPVSSKNQASAATLGLGIDPTTTTTTGYHLMPSANDQQQPPFQLVSPIDFSAAAADAAAWFNTTTTTTTSGGGGGSWHHMRSLSLPSALEHFQFGFDDDGSTSAAAAAALIDPAMLSDETGFATGTAAATPPNEPWADWINLDGDGPAPLGVEV